MGPPDTLVSDSGGAYTSNDFEAVCARLQHLLRHHREHTKGESYQNLMETHFNIQRRLYDYQFSLVPHPGGVGATASGLHPDLQYHGPSGTPEGPATSPDPGRGIGHGAKADSIPRTPSPVSSPRPYSREPPIGMGVSPSIATTSMSRKDYPRRGFCCGWPATQLRAAFDHVILAEYHCRYDWRDRQRERDAPGGVSTPHASRRRRAPYSRSPPKTPWWSIAHGRGVEHLRSHPLRNCCSSRWCTPDEPVGRGTCA